MQKQHFAFAAFFFVQNLARGTLLSVVPLKALDIVGSARDISVLLFAVSVGGILAALVMSKAINAFGTRVSFILSNSLMIAAVSLMSSWNLPFFAASLFLQIFAIASSDVVLSLYVMAKVPRKEITQFEPYRITFSILALAVGPFLGVYLQNEVDVNLPYICAGVFSVAAIVMFHVLGLHRVRTSQSKVPDARLLTNISRYFKQKRLILAYGLVMARSSWWGMFVVYTPIYASESGLGDLTGAGLVSAGVAWTLSVPFWGWCARRFGVKRILTAGYLASSVMTLCVFIASDWPWVAAGLLLAAALGTTILDGAGNVLFYRAVRSQERPEMTSVFVTYRDASQLLTPGVFMVLLNYFALPIVFLTASSWMMAAAWFGRFVPRRLR